MAQIIHTDIRQLPMEQVAAKAAQLALNQIGINKQVQMLSEEFGFNFTRRQVERLKTKDVYQRVVKEYTEGVVKSAISELRSGASNLVPKIIAALEKALDEGNIQAVPHALKILGVENVEPVQQAQQLTVVLPGAKTPERGVSET